MNNHFESNVVYDLITSVNTGNPHSFGITPRESDKKPCVFTRHRSLVTSGLWINLTDNQGNIIKANNQNLDFSLALLDDREGGCEAMAAFRLGATDEEELKVLLTTSFGEITGYVLAQGVCVEGAANSRPYFLGAVFNKGQTALIFDTSPELCKFMRIILRMFWGGHDEVF